MTKFKFLVPILALGMLGAAGAYAAGGHDHGGPPGGADMMAWHQEMCADRSARAAGRFAYLEARLSLTDTQRPAFETWKSAILTSVKASQAGCMAQMHDPAHPPTILDRQQRMELRLKARLAALDAELPALSAFYASLSPEQKTVLDMQRGGHFGHGGHGGRMMHHNMGGEHMDGPPPGQED